MNVDHYLLDTNETQRTTLTNDVLCADQKGYLYKVILQLSSILIIKSTNKIMNELHGIVNTGN